MTIENLGVVGIEEKKQTSFPQTDHAGIFPPVPGGGVFPPLPEEGIDLEALEEHYIKEAGKMAMGNDAKAAQLLKMSYYSFRYRKKKLKSIQPD